VTWDKPESQGICFVPDGKLRPALARLRLGLGNRPGEILNREGHRLGTHTGAVGYTLGQRKGLGLASGPWYVTEVDPDRNRLVVDRADQLWRRRLRMRVVRFVSPETLEKPVRVQVRHRHPSVPARIEPHPDGEAVLHLERAVWAPAAGQAGVVYDESNTRVLGGGWITDSA
jgi:tRNA-specific 2-thiouridylase